MGCNCERTKKIKEAIKRKKELLAAKLPVPPEIEALVPNKKANTSSNLGNPMVSPLSEKPVHLVLQQMKQAPIKVQFDRRNLCNMCEYALKCKGEIGTNRNIDICTCSKLESDNDLKIMWEKKESKCPLDRWNPKNIDEFGI